jgi:hypothetical protein
MMTTTSISTLTERSYGHEEITHEQVAELTKDWAPGRDETEYVFHSVKSTSWEKKYKGSGYSSFISGKLSSKDLLKKAFLLCQNRLNKMTSGMEKHHLSFHPKLNCTDGISVYVATEPADEKSLTPNQVLDVLLGATTHEAAHLLFTDFSKECESSFCGTILNLIEDERIEKLTCQKWPGFSVFLSAIKKYYFDFKYSKKTFHSEFDEIFDCFFKLIRYPKYVNMDLVAKHYSTLHKIKETLTPFPETFDEAYVAAHQITNLLKQYPGEKPGRKGGGRKMTGEEIEASLDLLAQTMRDLISANDKNGNTDTLEIISQSIENFTDAMEVQGLCSKVGNTIFQKADGDRKRYESLRNEVLPIAKQLSRILLSGNQETTQKNTGLRNGNLDDSKIAELVSGCATTFFEISPVERENLVLAVLTDESGSMDGKKIEDAARCCIAINEATKVNPNSLRFIYGFTSNHFQDGDNLITIYQEPGINNASAIGSMSAKSSNCDGECILAVAERIRKFTPKNCILLIISDGLPVSRNSASESDPIKETREAVEKISKEGFLPIQIGIQTEAEHQKEMFKHFVTFQNSSQLVKDLRKVIPSAISKLKKRG